METNPRIEPGVGRERMHNAEELRQLGLSEMRANRPEEAIALFDQALHLTCDEVLRELLTINKADALISASLDGPEVRELPGIILKRQNARHVYLAAYALQYKYQIAKNFTRAASYAKLALQASEEVHEDGWKSSALIQLGTLALFDSREADAIQYYAEALALLPETDPNLVRRGMAKQNLGYCLLLANEIERGLALIHEAVESLRKANADGYLPECYLDLCFGYLEIGELAKARHFGELGLEGAVEVRQTRNGHYLLGEVSYKSGDLERAKFHFGQLEAFYPDFPHLTDFLLAIDLRSIVNFKLS